MREAQAVEEGQAIQKSQEEQQQGGTLIMRMSRKVSLAVGILALAMFGGATPAMAESHPFIKSFGSLTNPNGIAVDEATGDVYVADIATNTIYKFDENGNPVPFTAVGLGAGNELSGSAAPAGAFSFPNMYGTPAAIAIDNSTNLEDPSRGDLYVMDAGHGAIDKFRPSGEYLSQIVGFTPSTGSHQNDELLGIAVDASGALRADLNAGVPNGAAIAVDVFNDSPENNLVAKQYARHTTEPMSGSPSASQNAHGFAAGPTGDNYLLYESCSCVVKRGQQLGALGAVDVAGSHGLAIAADPATGHVYVRGQASISEFDTGAMNGSVQPPENGPTSAGVLVGAPFGAASTSSTQGGIAADGANGRIYVSNPGTSPGTGKVEVFGSDAPAAVAAAADAVTKESATLHGSVNPRVSAVTVCEFEWEVADEFGDVAGEHYGHKTGCGPAVGAGATPVAVSASIGGLEAGLLYRFRLRAANGVGASESAGLLATPGVGFGVKRFDVKFLEKNGTPDTQAGSHPYKLVNDIEFNSHFVRTESNADSQYYKIPDGTLRDLKLDFPPGMVGDPNATNKKCTPDQLRVGNTGECPFESFLGEWKVFWSEHQLFGKYTFIEPIFNMTPPEGVAVQLGTHYKNPDLFINNGLLAGGDYPIQATVVNPATTAPVLFSYVTVYGDPAQAQAEQEEGRLGKPVKFTPKPFLTLPTGCHGPLRSTLKMDSYQHPGEWVETEEVTKNAAGTPVALTGCSKLEFPPEISAVPDTTDASTSSGLTVHVKVPQKAALNPEGLAESALRDTTVTLPQGMAINPSGGDGLEGCSEGLIGYEGQKELNKGYEPGVAWSTFTPDLVSSLTPGVSFCPDGSKIASVKIKTPLLEKELEGSMYLASQNSNPFGSLIAMYLVAEDKVSGSLIKLAGKVTLSPTGQIVTTFENTPDLPFEDLEIHFFGGERAPLTTPAFCSRTPEHPGPYVVTAVFTPWDGNGPVTATYPFQIEHGPNGGPCPGAKLPFSPAFTGGSTNLQAGSFTPLTGTFSREDGEQQIARLHFTLPPGLAGVLTGVKLCDEADANAGSCGPESLIGETTVAAGVGSDPITVSGGKVYLTGPYKGAPFGLSVVDPVKAGPFDLEHDTTPGKPNVSACDCVVVRAKLEIDPLTAAVTITSNAESEGFAIPHLIDGIPVELKKINFTTTRSNFQFNPTNCEKMAIAGSAESDQGESRPVSVPFQVTNCARLGFKPRFSAATSSKTSRADGASLHVRLVYPKGSFGAQANVRSVKVELPKQLPSRLPTLQKACIDKVFDSNPAACPAASRVGSAKAITPLIPVPLQGPAYFVSHGGAKFPELIVVLQGYGLTIDLHGETFIDKKTGVTSSTFPAVPDQPVESFELTLPAGPYSALAAPGGKLCAHDLKMPTIFTAQNGMVLRQSTPITVTGCKPAIRIVGHSVHGHKATIKVKVPSAGKLVASGRGINRSSKRVAKAGTVTIGVTLSGHDLRVLAKNPHERVNANVKLRFMPKHGRPLTASIRLLMG